MSHSEFRIVSSVFAVPSSQVTKVAFPPVFLCVPPANYSVCQTNKNGTVFLCSAEGRHKDAVIEWRSDGQLLTHSADTHITHNNTTYVHSGLYHFSSELITKFNSSPTCNITARGLSTLVSDVCEPATGSGILPV